MLRLLIAGFIIYSTVIGYSYGQTTRYWSLNFATESSILAGAVVGGFAENQAIYYNPASIPESKSDNIGLSGEIVQLDFYKAKNAFGRDIDMKLTQLNIVPSYVSILLKSKKKEDLSIQLALLTRDKNDFDILESRIGKTDIYPTFEGLEDYAVLYENTIRYIDIWAGAGLAYKFSDRFSMGFSAFISYKRFTDKLTKSFKIVPWQPPDSLLFYSNLNEISRTDIINYKVQTKLGLQYQFSKWRFGLNFSIPSILIFDNVKRYREVGISRVYNESDDGFYPDEILIGAGQDVSGIFKDPLSVAIGVNYCSVPERDMIGVSIEYFKKIPVYKLVDVPGFDEYINPKYPDLTKDEFLSLWYGANSIFNVSLGYRKYINESLTLLGGIRTDFDYLKNVDFTDTGNEYNNFIKFYADVIHFTGGARFNISRHRFVVGAQYSFGKENKLRQLADFVPRLNIGSDDLPFENLEEASVEYRYNGVALFFGFIFNFLDRKEDPVIKF